MSETKVKSCRTAPPEKREVRVYKLRDMVISSTNSSTSNGNGKRAHGKRRRRALFLSVLISSEGGSKRMSSPTSSNKKLGGKAKGTTAEETRRRRDDQTVQIRKSIQQDLIQKHRKVSREKYNSLPSLPCHPDHYFFLVRPHLTTIPPIPSHFCLVCAPSPWWTRHLSRVGRP